MLKMIQALKNRKGFTLMELIVVLIILAILIAALTPVLIGWISDARETAIRAEGRTVLLAIQTTFTEAKGTGEWNDATPANRPFGGWNSTRLINDQTFIRLITDAGLEARYLQWRGAGEALPGMINVVLDGPAADGGNVVGLIINNPVRPSADSDTLGAPNGRLVVGRRPDATAGTIIPPLSP